MELAFGPRRGRFLDLAQAPAGEPLDAAELACFERFDLLYRSLCALLFNYAPTSGHPGGSISSGRIVAALLFDSMDYALADPRRPDADLVVYAAGHKALGLYAMWALRNEVARLGASDLLPEDRRLQLRFEDLLGFRRNPVTDTPLFEGLGARPLDGHPTPATPFVPVATGASGVGLAAALGLGWGALDFHGRGGGAPRVHVVEGEGGLTPGRVAEALAAAGTAGLENVIVHVDWNQASIDSDRVCREGQQPGDYVQWSPAELFYLHDWNVVSVPDGADLQQVVAAQRAALAMDTGQPTAVVYRTTKGWRYGIEGRASHGAGHPLCSDGFYRALAPLFVDASHILPRCDAAARRCDNGADPAVVEACFWEALSLVRKKLEEDAPLVEALARRLRASRDRFVARDRRPRDGAPGVERAFDAARAGPEVPAPLRLTPGAATTLRGELGRCLGHLNRESGGALLVAAADLLGSTSVNAAGEGLGKGFFHARTNPSARLLSVGGICEDAAAGVLSGLSAYGRHIGVGSSYAAFIAPLGHIASRLHAIGNQARHELDGGPARPFILVCAHAGLKTGEDGPTHADPQALQVLQDNFPVGTMITLTPWDPQEVWPLLAAALTRRPSVVAPFVTRPAEVLLDRAARGLAPARDAAQGVYRLRAARREGAPTIVLQGSGVTYAFLQDALPVLDAAGIDLDVHYVASAELFDLLPPEERARIWPPERAQDALGITDFTLPTLFRWVRSDLGQRSSLHPFQGGRFLGSGPAARVMTEAGLDGPSQVSAIRRWLAARGAAALTQVPVGL